MHQENIKQLYIETEKILVELIKQINIYSKNKNSDSRIEQLEAEQIKLKNHDLVIAIVGTMKAGKSTTINAIVGQEILPHRVEAMTTLPTLVTHKKNQTIPTLYFPKINILKKFIDDVKDKLNSAIEIDLKFEILADDIKKNKLQLKGKYEGKENIFKFLKDINELMRLASTIGIYPPYKDFQNTDDFPRIEVEFFYLKNNKELVDSKFTLMDTPGPNEAKHSEYLGKISKKQTEQASAVILAIDYTQISGESSASIKEQVNEALQYIGKDKVYILLNKFDEDRKQSNEKGYEGARDYFGKEFLGDNFTNDKVFPVSSRDAFYANLGLNEIKINSCIDESLPWRKEFGEIIIGRRWQKIINKNDEVKEYCDDAFEDSYFNKPMQMIINNSYENSKLEIIYSGLETMKGISGELNNEFNTEIESLTVKIDTLKKQVVDIKADMELIKNISIDIGKDSDLEMQGIKINIGETLDSKLDDFNKKIKKSFESKIDTIKNDEIEKQNQNLENNHREKWSFFGIDLKQNTLKNKQEESNKEFSKTYDELRKNGKIIFEDEIDKQNFIQSIQKEANEILTKFQEDSYSKIEDNINVFIPKLNKMVKVKLLNIIDEIKKNMGKEVIFKIPEIIFDKLEINQNLEFEAIVKTEDVGKTEYINQNSIWGGIKRTFDFFDNNWGKDEIVSCAKHYEITTKDIIHEISIAMKNVKNRVEREIEQEFNKKVNKPIEEEIHKLTTEIELLHLLKEDILKKRQANEINIEEKISLAEKGKKYLKKINQRLNQVSIEMEKNNE